MVLITTVIFCTYFRGKIPPLRREIFLQIWELPKLVYVVKNNSRIKKMFPTIWEPIPFFLKSVNKKDGAKI